MQAIDEITTVLMVVLSVVTYDQNASCISREALLTLCVCLIEKAAQQKLDLSKTGGSCGVGKHNWMFFSFWICNRASPWSDSKPIRAFHKENRSS